eukprot:TRINITY_DN2501_c0_g1_i1.p2 TRINITY_DN2501_c0_g1~~TRINITY_DN2501_c0_g1_i1.p2  ORF type:complete len:298 (-),score=65.59 TRINITY_DN2501_c0_g1_i1:98-991(-)
METLQKIKEKLDEYLEAYDPDIPSFIIETFGDKAKSDEVKLKEISFLGEDCVKGVVTLIESLGLNEKKDAEQSKKHAVTLKLKKKNDPPLISGTRRMLVQACNQAKDSVQKGMKRSDEAKSEEEQKKSVFDRLKKPADRQSQRKDNEDASTESKEPINLKKRKHPDQQNAAKHFKEDGKEVKNSAEEKKVKWAIRGIEDPVSLLADVSEEGDVFVLAPQRDMPKLPALRVRQQVSLHPPASALQVRPAVRQTQLRLHPSLCVPRGLLQSRPVPPVHALCESEAEELEVCGEAGLAGG